MKKLLVAVLALCVAVAFATPSFAKGKHHKKAPKAKTEQAAPTTEKAPKHKKAK